MFHFHIYSDASISLTGNVRTSWVIKIADADNTSNNTVSRGSELAAHKLPCGHSTAAELYSIYIAAKKLTLFLYEHTQYRLLLSFTFYSDSQSAILGLTQPSTRCRDYEQIFSAILSSISHLPGHVEFLWLNRSKNKEADKLTKQRTRETHVTLQRAQIIRLPNPILTTRLRGIQAIHANCAYRDRLRERQKG